MFEQTDILGSYWSPYVQLKPKIITPPGEVIAETEIYYHLAQRLGLNTGSDQLPEPGDENIEKWLSNRIKGYSDLKLSDLKAGPVLAPGLQSIAWSDMKFETPSGKIELYSYEAHSRWGISPLPEYVPIQTAADQRWFPLIFITPNTGSRIHSQFGNLKIIRESVAEPAAGISPADALQRNIISGQTVRVFNENGEIKCVVNVNNRIPEGVVVLPNGIWTCEGGGGNSLISGRETDIGFGAAFHDNRVEVERVI
jgi:anaerobic selenocysteine-containing dehydrogenase